jgi:adenylosuccinate synthase
MMPGWSDDISGAGRMADLPKAAVAYIDRLEELLATRVSIIGVGPERNQTIFR